MKCLFWNLRGIANPPTKLALKRLLKLYKPDFCFIAKPWMNLARFPVNWFSRLNLKVFVVNNRNNLIPNLWCICNINLIPQIITLDDQQVTFTITEDNKVFAISAVYASTCYIKRRLL